MCIILLGHSAPATNPPQTGSPPLSSTPHPSQIPCSLRQFSALWFHNTSSADSVSSPRFHSLAETPLASLWLLVASLGLAALLRPDIWLPVVCSLPTYQLPHGRLIVLLYFSLSHPIYHKRVIYLNRRLIPPGDRPEILSMALQVFSFSLQ